MSHASAQPRTSRRRARLAALLLVLAMAVVACGPRFDRTEIAGAGVGAGQAGQVGAPGVAGQTMATTADGTSAADASAAGTTGADGTTTGAGTPTAESPTFATGGAPAADGGSSTTASGDQQAAAGATPAQQSSAPGAADPGPHPGVTDDTIKIGYLVPLTGAAPIPQSWDKGANLYWDVKNANGGIHGRKVQLFIEDTKSNTTTAVQKARKLVTQDKVFTIVTLDRLEVQEAVARELEGRNYPHVMVQSPTPPPASWKNTFTISIDHTVQGRAVARFFASELSGRTKVAIVREQTNALKPGADAFVAEAKKQGLQVVANETINPNNTQFQQTVLRLQQAGAQLVWLYMAPEPAAKIINQAGAAGYQPDWFANSISWNFELMHSVAGQFMDGHAYAFSPWVALSDPRTANYKKAWNSCSSCSGQPDDIGLVGWGVGGVLDAALTAAGQNLGQNTFRDALHHLKVATDVWAPLDFTGGGSIGTNQVAVYASKGGHWQMMGDFRSFGS